MIKKRRQRASQCRQKWTWLMVSADVTLMMGQLSGREMLEQWDSAPIRQIVVPCVRVESKSSQVQIQREQLMEMELAVDETEHAPFSNPLQSKSFCSVVGESPKKSPTPHWQQSYPTRSLTLSPIWIIMAEVLAMVGLGRYQNSCICRMGPYRPPQTLALTPSNPIVVRQFPLQVLTKLFTEYPQQTWYCLLQLLYENSASEVKKQTQTNSPPSQSSPLVLALVLGMVILKALELALLGVIKSMLVLVSLIRLVGLPDVTQQSLMVQEYKPPL